MNTSITDRDHYYHRGYRTYYSDSQNQITIYSLNDAFGEELLN